jgi:hypothetical protein
MVVIESLSLSGTRRFVKIGNRRLPVVVWRPPVTQAWIFEQVQEHAIDFITNRTQYVDTF